MSIKTPLEDFVKTTLGAVPGYWHKLVYLANLRSSPETYDHWGMARRYGLAASHSAISAAHCDLFMQVLRTPIQGLLEDAGDSSSFGSHEADFFDDLWERRERMLPTDLGGGSAKHFEVTLLTVRKLIQTQKNGKSLPE
jgi:hypothetical protein